MTAVTADESMPPDSRDPTGTSATMRRETASRSRASSSETSASAGSVRCARAAARARPHGSQYLSVCTGRPKRSTLNVPGSIFHVSRKTVSGAGTYPNRRYAATPRGSISGLKRSTTCNALSSDAKSQPALPRLATWSGFLPSRSRASRRLPSRRSQIPRANIPQRRATAAAGPRAAAASTTTSVSDIPRNLAPRRPSSARRSRWLYISPLKTQT